MHMITYILTFKLFLFAKAGKGFLKSIWEAFAMAKKAQSSVEYLMIIGVVLVIALVVIGLSMFFTSTAPVQEEIEVYWATQVRPLRVIAMQGYYYSSVAPTNGELALTIQNIDSKPITLRNIILSPYPVASDLSVFSNHSATGAASTGLIGYAGPNFASNPNISITLAPSEKVSIFIRGNTTGTYFCSTGNDELHFRKTMSFQYDTPYFTQNIFTGIKPMQGGCNRIG